MVGEGAKPPGKFTAATPYVQSVLLLAFPTGAFNTGLWNMVHVTVVNEDGTLDSGDYGVARFQRGFDRGSIPPRS